MTTLKKAKKELGLNTLKVGFGANALSYWYAADMTPEEMKQAIQKTNESQTDPVP